MGRTGASQSPLNVIRPSIESSTCSFLLGGKPDLRDFLHFVLRIDLLGLVLREARR